jgi:hypothetical protein
MFLVTIINKRMLNLNECIMRKTQFWLFAILFTLMLGVIYSGCKKDEETCTPGDATELNATINEAQQLHDNAVEGTNPGEYTAGSKAQLQAAIDLAKGVRDSECPSQTQLNNANTALEAAMVAFEAQKITDVNPNALVAHWLFNGDAVDASGNGHDGTASEGYSRWGKGMPALAEDRHGNADYCYFFQKGANFVVSQSPSLNPDDLSISVWMKVDTLWPHGYFLSNDIWHSWKFQVPEHFKPFFTRFISLDDGSGDAHINEDSNFPLDWDPAKWQHVAITYTKGKLIFYVDGNPVREVDVAAGAKHDPHAGIDFCIGQALPSASFTEIQDDPHQWKEWLGYFKGWLDDIRIYNEVLTPAQVKSLYDYEKDNAIE